MQFLLTLASAALYVAAMPPWNLDLLAWVALVPFLHALRGAGAGRAALLGLVWGTACIWGIGYWVPISVASYWGQPLWFGLLFSFVGSIVFLGSYGAGFAASATWLARGRAGIPRALLLAALWVTWELARGTLLTGDPWLLLGYALVQRPLLIQAADLGGIYLLSFIVALTNAAIAGLISGHVDIAAARTPRAAALMTTALLPPLLLVGYGIDRLKQPYSSAETVPVAVIQGNNDLGSQWRREHYGKGLHDYLRLSDWATRDGNPAVLIWPESAVTFFPAREAHLRQPIARLAARRGVELLVGAPHIEDPDPARPLYYNSAFHFGSRGRITDRYDKVHLLPFGEYFPLRTIQFLRRRFERVRTFTPGRDARALQTAVGQAAVLICFEAIFPDLVRRRMNGGAEILVNLSNDAWLGNFAGPEQHAAMVVVRAVENRTWVIRATTTGVSSIIDPHGRVVTRSEIGEEAILRARVASLAIPTLYQRLGNWPGHLCLAVALLVAAVRLFRERRPATHEARARPIP